MDELFAAFAEYFEIGGFFHSMLSAAITIYGVTFLFNIACLFIINKRFLYLLNIQTGDNYVFSSSSAFNDNKGTLPATVGLMLLIPFFYNYYILHYAYVLRKTFPNVKISMPPYWLLSVVATVVALMASTVLSYAVSVGKEYESITGFGSLPFIPMLLLLAALLTCYIMMYTTMRKNFSPYERKED